MAVKFTDNRIAIKGALNDKAIAFLYEACGELSGQAADNTRRRTGETAEAWTYKIDEGKLEGKVGNPLQNAIWEEFGTGEYALKKNGRKGGWYYRDKETGKMVHTFGKTPTRALHNAFVTLKTPIVRRAQELFKGVGK